MENYYGLHYQNIPRGVIPYNYDELNLNDEIINPNKFILIYKGLYYQIKDLKDYDYLSNNEIYTNWKKL